MKKIPQSEELGSPSLLRRALAFAGASICGANLAFAAPSTTVVISQVYGGGGNTGAPYKNDFVELHNISGSSVSLAGWRIQYSSATGTGTWTNGLNLSGSIPSGGYFLISMAAGSGGNGIALPTPDQSGSVDMSGTAGKVALTNTTTQLSGGNPSSGTTVVDFVGFGTTAVGYEGTGPTPAPSNSTSVSRLDSGSKDTDQNATDFVTGTPTPRNSSTTPYVPISDTTAPTVTTFTPANNATGVIVATALTIQFSENVTKNTGDITVKLVADGTSFATIPVASSAVLVSGSTATITLPSNLTAFTEFYVNMPAATFKDVVGNSFAGISDASTWKFTTGSADVTSPSAVSLAPADDSTGVLPTMNLTIGYDENIVAGTGTLLIKKVSDTSTVETISIPSAQVSITGSNVTINPASVLDYNTAYYAELSVGSFKDTANNPSPAITGNTAWNFTTRTAPSVLISQYYEGLNSDRYIELKNLTASPLPLTGFRLSVWYDTYASGGSEGWKTGTSASDPTRETALDLYTIPANGHFLIALTNAAAPIYAASNNDLSVSTGSTMLYNGNDSIVLYSGTGSTQAEVVDAISITGAGNEGLDTTIYRLNNATGFDFNSGTTILNAAATWGTKTLAEVASAAETDAWYLAASQPPRFLTISGLTPTSVSEGAGEAAVTGTVNRTGPTDASLEVLISVSDDSELSPTSASVTIPIGASSAPFTLDAVNDAYIDGDQQVTITVAATLFVPDTDVVTVLDEALDPAFPVVINEVDADSATAEFIELYNNSNAAISLDGVVLVLYNGSLANDPSYTTIDLTGKTIGAHDYYVIGSATVPNVDWSLFTTNGIQNGEDAVALYLGTPAEFPANTPAATTNGTLVDALVYETNDPDDTVLIAALTPGKPQVNESANSLSSTQSMSRATDGGANFDTTLYVAQTPTPGATNVLITGYELWKSAVGGQTADLDYDGDGLDNGTEYFMGTAGNAFTVNPGVVGGAVTWPRAAGTTISSFKVEVSTNLSFWENATVNYAANLSIGASQVVFTMPSGPVKLFVRLSVTP